jgi:hypothetical protein
MQRVILILGLSAILVVSVLATPGSSAEVVARTTRGGEYVSTTVIPGGPSWNPGIWGVSSRTSLRRATSVLNPEGDRRGDLAPEVVETPTAPHYPWAVWSRFNGTDYDLVWSTWDRAWSAVSPLAPAEMSISGDDLDPSLTFNKLGRPLIAWWNQDAESGRGEVYFSMFLENRWMEPLRVSGDDLGGRQPQIYINRHGQIEIRYISNDGRSELTQQVLLFNPGTITDDIDPQTLVYVTVGTISVKRKY